MSKKMYQSDTLYDMAPLQQTVIRANLAGVVASTDDLFLIEQLRSGNEAAFVSLVDRYAPTMLRLAMIYVRVWVVAEEVVQETWMAVLEGLGRFEGRSSLKTWLFRILTNCAITRAQREGRSIPFSSLPDSDPDLAEPAVDPDRFFPADHQWSGRWVSFPQGKHMRALRKRLKLCPPVSVRSSSCATSRGGRRRKPAAFSGYPRPISACSSTGRDRRSVERLKSISRKSRLHKIFRNY